MVASTDGLQKHHAEPKFSAPKIDDKIIDTACISERLYLAEFCFLNDNTMMLRFVSIRISTYLMMNYYSHALQKIESTMRVILPLSILLAASILLTAANALSDQNELVDRLNAGGHILMIRHAMAPGNGDPSNFKIGDCSTQRNLDHYGQAQAQNIGKWLRNKGIESVRVYSSQWCRCLETANLMGLGSVQELTALNSFYEHIQNREPHLSALNDFISRQPAEGELIIFVTHFVTIAAMTGKSVSSGEGILLQLNKDASYTVVGHLDFGLE